MEQRQPAALLTPELATMNRGTTNSFDTETRDASCCVLSRLARWVLGGALVVFAVGLLYALSMGPALLLNKRGAIRVETLEKIYMPLSLLTDAIPGSQRLLESYVRLWVAEGR